MHDEGALVLSVLSSDRLHATTVSIGGQGVLLEGPSGIGKSDLALRLIDRGAMLVSDDQTIVVRSGTRLLAHPPASIAGRIEVRGLGIIVMPYVVDIPIALLVRLGIQVPRMPEQEARRIAGIDIPVLLLEPLQASAPLKVELALTHGILAA